MQPKEITPGVGERREREGYNIHQNSENLSREIVKLWYTHTLVNIAIKLF